MDVWYFPELDLLVILCLWAQDTWTLCHKPQPAVDCNRKKQIGTKMGPRTVSSLEASYSPQKVAGKCFVSHCQDVDQSHDFDWLWSALGIGLVYRSYPYMCMIFAASPVCSCSCVIWVNGPFLQHPTHFMSVSSRRWHMWHVCPVSDNLCIIGMFGPSL